MIMSGINVVAPDSGYSLIHFYSFLALQYYSVVCDTLGRCYCMSRSYGIALLLCYSIIVDRLSAITLSLLLFDVAKSVDSICCVCIRASRLLSLRV